MVKKFLWPAVDVDLMADQFGFRPIGSTTCALVNILHNVHQMFEDGNDYINLYFGSHRPV